MKIVIYSDNSFSVEEKDGDDAIFHGSHEFQEIAKKYCIKENRHCNEKGVIKKIENVMIVIFPSLKYKKQGVRKKKFINKFKRRKNGKVSNS